MSTSAVSFAISLATMWSVACCLMTAKHWLVWLRISATIMLAVTSSSIDRYPTTDDGEGKTQFLASPFSICHILLKLQPLQDCFWLQFVVRCIFFYFIFHYYVLFREFFVPLQSKKKNRKVMAIYRSISKAVVAALVVVVLASWPITATSSFIIVVTTVMMMIAAREPGTYLPSFLG